MLSIAPIPEGHESNEITPVYTAIKQVLRAPHVPLIFQYLAVFPTYLSYMWKQVEKNIADPLFLDQTHSIRQFGDHAMGQIYHPSKKIAFLVDTIDTMHQKETILSSVDNLSRVTSILYLVSIAIRESFKGIQLGLKQIGVHTIDSEREIFSDFSADLSLEHVNTQGGDRNLSHTSQSLTTSYFAPFLREIESEMKELLKRETYLHRRVALEKFALSKLNLLREPIDSSFRTVSQMASSQKAFPELIYILSDLFPTQTPHKLLTTSVMKIALSARWDENSPKSHAILLPPPINTGSDL